MIRELKTDDIERVNLLLNEVGHKISINSFDNPFFKALVYVEEMIQGIIIYDLLYDRIEIEYIVVDKLYRKSGIGTKLIKEIEKNNIKNITLEVRASNKSAIEFYKRNGYKIETIRKNYYASEDGYLMLKELGE